MKCVFPVLLYYILLQFKCVTPLRWHGCLSAKVNKNANLGYSHDWGLSQFQGCGFFQGNPTLKMDNLDCTEINAISKNSQLVYGRGSFTTEQRTLLAPPLPLMSVHNSALFHTQPLLKCLVYGIAPPTVNCAFQLKPSPALQAPGHCH